MSVRNEPTLVFIPCFSGAVAAKTIDTPEVAGATC
jgi:hypothetical protein